MVRTVGIGHQDFVQLISSNNFYIDKTLFIKEWWENNDAVTLLTRPRRFGKTLNMSMLEYFFSIEYAGRADLFEDLFIWAEEKYRHLGLIVALFGWHLVTSNRESGFGRYDVMLKPFRERDDAVILEFKVHNPDKEKSLSDTVQSAHHQIEEKKYSALFGGKRYFNRPDSKIWICI